MNRRTVLAATALAPFAGSLGLRDAAAQARFANMNMFIPAGPGGGWDGLGRAIEQVARHAGLVGNFQFENVGGAGGIVGLPRFVSQRRGRGDALMVSGSIMVGAVLSNRSPVSLANVTPIARMTQEVGVVVVPAQSDIQDIAGLLAAFRANPGGTSVAGGSAGGTDHITLGLILRALGRNAREGSYVAFAGGGPAQAAILGAQVKAGISGYSEFAEQIRAGRMRALATTGATRSDPNIPTLKESGVDVVIANWRGVFGAPGINANQKAALTSFITDLVALPAWREMMETRGWDNAFLAGAEFERFLAADISATESVLKELGLA
ncbi:Bug family tripartite tricarboxylate transporter substrate binding protein [Roseococcus pinisoli]|uniref:Tripartite tricarboxylate transporter substrate binding protein n=1 Tax=Roseococcus pinisoli TaxID=2835040 RepID=A0ABS5QIF0_9PROT|nr:tripartite tricarboxylate transporter substrate-binding protein [Roseococcus pinisoli]MBS7813466.1 tripartite tricarboxylate transporter substrate binding protein [Roseococcus pinisoli]